MSMMTFGWNVAIALIASLLGGVLFEVLSLGLTNAESLRCVIVILGGLYTGWLMWSAKVTIGRLAILAAWSCVTLVLLIINPPVLVWLALQLTLICLVRCCYLYEHVWFALLDALLCGLSLAAAWITALHSHSLWLSLWSFFLLQALFIFIPTKTNQSKQTALIPEIRFDQAHRHAVQALEQLSEHGRHL